MKGHIVVKWDAPRFGGRGIWIYSLTELEKTPIKIGKSRDGTPYFTSPCAGGPVDGSISIEWVPDLEVRESK